MFREFVIRRATTADGEAVLRIAAAGMHQFGLVPDFAGLGAELGRIGTLPRGRQTAEIENSGSAQHLALTEATMPDRYHSLIIDRKTRK